MNNTKYNNKHIDTHGFIFKGTCAQVFLHLSRFVLKLTLSGAKLKKKSTCVSISAIKGAN